MKTVWMPRAAVSHYEAATSEYERPALSANVGDRIQLSADAVQFGFAVFEGMRVYVADNQYLVFRARDHHERLMGSCAALGLPCPGYDVFLDGIRLIVENNYDGHVRRLYVRPIVFAAGGGIMPQQDRAYTYAALCTTFDPQTDGLKVMVETEQPRTVPAFAAIKTATNYTSSAIITRRAQTLGYDTVLWLDRGAWLQECTTMNIFLQLNGELVTPRLGGILSGITRRTMIELLAGEGGTVVERDIHITEVVDAAESGALAGAFATSTALGINNVTVLRHRDREYTLPATSPPMVATAKGRYRLLTEEFPVGLASHPAIAVGSYVGAIGSVLIPSHTKRRGP